jgi:hypothetical protein
VLEVAVVQVITAEVELAWEDTALMPGEPVSAKRSPALKRVTIAPSSGTIERRDISFLATPEFLPLLTSAACLRIAPDGTDFRNCSRYDVPTRRRYTNRMPRLGLFGRRRGVFWVVRNGKE